FAMSRVLTNKVIKVHYSGTSVRIVFHPIGKGFFRHYCPVIVFVYDLAYTIPSQMFFFLNSRIQHLIYPFDIYAGIFVGYSTSSDIKSVIRKITLVTVQYIIYLNLLVGKTE